MAVDYYTNGTATITVDSQTLGIAAAEGVKVSINHFAIELFSDEFGPQMACEILNNGGSAIVTFQLLKFDPTRLAAWDQKRFGGGTTGTVPYVGRLMFSESDMSTMSIASPNSTGVYTFPRCVLLDSVEYELSTQAKRVNCVVKCHHNGSGVLYTLA